MKFIIISCAAMLLLLCGQVLAGNIFIEEGDLFIGTGVEVEFDPHQEELARVHILMAQVTDVEQFKTLSLGFDPEPGHKLTILNLGNGEWEIRDTSTDAYLGTISQILVR